VIKEDIWVIKKYRLRYSSNIINTAVHQDIKYYPIYQLIEIFVIPKDSKDYLKKNLKRDIDQAGIYKEFIRYDLDKKKTAMINAAGFKIIISFLVNQSLVEIKKYIDLQPEPIKSLDEIIQKIVEDLIHNLEI